MHGRGIPRRQSAEGTCQAVALMPGRAAVQRSLSARVFAGRGRTPQTFCLRYEAGAALTSSYSQAVAPRCRAMFVYIDEPDEPEPSGRPGLRHMKTNATDLVTVPCSAV
jgi:hypothetical protein